MDDVIEKHNRGIRRCRIFIITLIFLTIIFAITSICCGSVLFDPVTVIKAIVNHYFDGTFPEILYWQDMVIINGRFPRTIMCILVGASLGIAGTMMQGVLRNPLVSPFTLGVSSAATFGAALVIVYLGGFSFARATLIILGHKVTMSTFLMAVGASALGIMSIGFVFLLCSRKNIGQSTVILAGVVIGYLFQAGVTFLKDISDDEQLREITLWTMGGMWNSSWPAVIVTLPVVVVCIVALWKLSLDVNSLSTGDDIATSIGIDVRKVRSEVLVLSTIAVSVGMGFTGVIGFIGLMGPHLSRMVIGNNTRYLLPASGFFGACLLLACDTCGRMIISPAELPAGVLMYLIGGAFFVWLVLHKKRSVM